MQSRTSPRRVTGFIQPCLPIRAPEPPSGAGWLHEIKFDGFRLMGWRHGNASRLLTRRGNDWTDRYPSVVAALGGLEIRSCLIDGETTVCDDRGLPVFNRLRYGNRVKPEAVLYAFDLLELDGEDLRARPIEVRKTKLRRLMRDSGPSIQLSDHLLGDAAEIFLHACKLGCEGIVSKRAGSPYVSGRTSDWLKLKNPEAPAVRREAEEDWGR